MAFYDDMQALAGDLLTEFRQGTTGIRVATVGTGPAHAPGATTYSTAHPFNGAVRGVTAHHMQDTRVQAGDLVVTAPGALRTTAGAAIALKLTDLVTIGGKDYTIVKLSPKPATGTVVAYSLIVRG